MLLLQRYWNISSNWRSVMRFIREKPSELDMFAMFEALVNTTGFWPALLDAVKRGYTGQSCWFYKCRKLWAQTLAEKPPKRNHGAESANTVYMPDIQAETANVRSAERYQGRPLEQPQLSPTVLALRDYRKAARNCGLSRTRGK